MFPAQRPGRAWGFGTTHQCSQHSLLSVVGSRPAHRSTACSHSRSNRHRSRPRLVWCAAAEEDPYAALQEAAAASGLRISFSSSGEDEEDWEEALEELDDPWAPAAPEWLDLLDQDPAAAAAALRPIPPPAPPSTPAPDVDGEESPFQSVQRSDVEQQQQQQAPERVPLVPPVEVLEVAGGLTIPCITPQQVPALASAAAGGVVMVQLLEAPGAAADSTDWSSLLPPVSQVRLTIPQLTAAAAAPWRESQAAVVVLDTGDHRGLQACIRLSRVYALPQVYLLKG